MATNEDYEKLVEKRKAIKELIHDVIFAFYHGDGGYVSGRMDGVFEVAEIIFGYEELEKIKKENGY